MTQPALPPSTPDATAAHSEDDSSLISSETVSIKTWHRFFAQFTAITGATALVLALVFFIAYNWIYMGKMGKFGLVESALILSVIGYAVLAYKGIFKLGQQLLLLIASIITGSLLALIGQVYQTGADSWQLFFAWCVLILPWVFIARLPALWLLWLGLVNLSFSLYIATNPLWFSSYIYSDLLYIIIMMAVNFVALVLGLTGRLELHEQQPSESTKQALHWSLYLVAIAVIFFASKLGLFPIFESTAILSTSLSLGLWLGTMVFFYYSFRIKQIDLFMLTLFCGSVIIVVIAMTYEYIATKMDFSGLLLLAFILIAMSASAVSWLQKLHKIEKSHPKQNQSLHSNKFENKPVVSQQPLNDSTAANSLQNHSLPWYLHLFLGLSGLISGALTTGFLALLFNDALKDTLITLILSLLLLGVSLFLYNPQFFQRPSKQNNKNKLSAEANKSNVYKNSVAFSLSLSAQAFLLLLMLDWLDSSVEIISAVMLLQLIFLIIFRDTLHRFFSSLIALSALIWLLGYYQLPELSAAVLALITIVVGLPASKLVTAFVSNNQSALCTLRTTSLFKAIYYSSTTLLLIISVAFIAADHSGTWAGIGSEFAYNYLLAQGLLIAVCFYAAHLILSHYQLKLSHKPGPLIALAILGLGVVSIYVSGILTTSLVIVMAVANHNKVLLGLGVTALIGYIFWYYYQLDTSLLVKSGSLLAVAIVLLVIRRLLQSPYSVTAPSSSPSHLQSLPNKQASTSEEELS